MAGTLAQQLSISADIMTSLSGLTVTIDSPAATENVTPWSKGSSAGWSIRQLMSYVSSIVGSNYSVVIPEYGKVQFKLNASDYLSVSEDDYAPLTIGFSSSDIDCIQVSKTGTDTPTPPAGKTLSDMGVFRLTGLGQPTPAGTLKIVCPFVDKNLIESTGLSGMLGRNFGTEFSCPNVRTDRIVPALTQIQFAGQEGTFYISSATYHLTTKGIYASLSGTARQMSDYDFIGATEEKLNNQIAFGPKYGYLKISKTEGIIYDDTDEEEINSSEEEDEKDKKDKDEKDKDETETKGGSGEQTI